MSEVIVAGHICLDISPKIHARGLAMDEVLRPGKLENVGSCCVSLGGPVSNTGIALSILGQDVALMCKVGDDLFGGVVEKKIEEYGTAKAVAVDAASDTSYTVALVVPGYDRIFLHNPGANNTFTAADVDFEKVAQCRLFHFGYPPLMEQMYKQGGEQLTQIFKRAKELGATTSLDMSLPDRASESGQQDWNAILENTLPYVDIFIPSVEETLFMLYPDKYDAFAREHEGEKDPLDTLDLDILPMLGDRLMELGAKIAVIKCGVRGYYIRTAENLAGFGRIAPADTENWQGREIMCESYHIDNIVSATGSGDSSIAGFLSAFMNGESITECMEIACTTGAENLTAQDALSGIRSMEETLAFRKTLRKNVYHYAGSYWVRDVSSGLQYGKKDKCFG